MRIRLVQPPLVQPFYRQLTLPVVGAEFAAHGFDVEVSDENVEDLDLSPVELVGITVHVYNAPRAFEIARLFRQRGARVLMGGTFPTVAPHLVLPHCDSVVAGEVEGQTERIARDARQGRLEPLYRASAPPPLAHTVRPDLSLIERDEYLKLNFPLEVSRGCRFACRFCTADALWPTARTRALEEIERDLGQYDHGLVELLDVNFLNDAPFFETALPVLGAARVPGWTGQTTLADLAADPALPERLARSRCRAVFVGLETISAEGLRSVDKAWSRPEALLGVARRLQEAGILLQVGLIAGLDSDEPSTFERTADLLEEAHVQSVIVSYLHYYPGTAPYDELARHGRLLSTDWRDLDGNHAVVRPLGMSVPALEEAVERFLGRFYGLASIGRRTGHAGLARAPSQLVHHLANNAILRSYYRDQGGSPARPGGASARYMGRPPAGNRLEKWAADASARLLDWIWRP